jgi:HAD superfamily hydrolase (TIGR01509 family)
MSPHLPDAVMFDMDGTLVMTEELWYDAEAEIMAGLDVAWGPEHQAELVGGPLEAAVDYMVRHTEGALTHDTMMALLLDTMERNLRTRPVEWCPGARELLVALEDAGVPCALVSASWRRLVEAVHDAVLHEVGHEMFATSVAGDEGERTKPFPDPYLLAAERMGVEPSRCVVLEDSHTGVASGVASGALVVAVPSLVPIEGHDGLHVVESLAQVTPALLGEWSHDWSSRA